MDRVIGQVLVAAPADKHFYLALQIMADIISDVRQQAAAKQQQHQQGQGVQPLSAQAQQQQAHQRLQVALPDDPAGSLRPSAAPSPLPDLPASPRSGASYWLGPTGRSPHQPQPLHSPRQQQQHSPLGQHPQQAQQQALQQQDHPSGVWSELDALALPTDSAGPYSELDMEVMGKAALAAALVEAQQQVERLRGIIRSLTADMEALQQRQLEQGQEQQEHGEQWLAELAATLRSVPEVEQGSAAAATVAALLAGALRRVASGAAAGEPGSGAAAADVAVLQAEVRASDADLAHALQHVEALQQQVAAAAGPQPGSSPAARPQAEPELLFLRGRLQQLMHDNRQLRRQCAQLQLALASSGLQLAAAGAPPASLGAATAPAAPSQGQEQQQQQLALAKARSQAERLQRENERLMDLSNSLRAERDRLQQQLAALAAAPGPAAVPLLPGPGAYYGAWPAAPALAPGAAYPGQGYAADAGHSLHSYAPAAGLGPGPLQQQPGWDSSPQRHGTRHHKRQQQQQYASSAGAASSDADAEPDADQSDGPESHAGHQGYSYGSPPAGSPPAGRWPGRSPRQPCSSSSAAAAELRARQLAAAGASPGSSPGRPAVAGSSALLPATMSARETASQRERLRAMQRRRESAAAAAAEQRPRVRNYSIQNDDDPRALLVVGHK
jgi:hypothetical protein